MKRKLVKVRIKEPNIDHKKRKMMEHAIEKEFDRYLDEQFQQALLAVAKNNQQMGAL